MQRRGKRKTIKRKEEATAATQQGNRRKIKKKNEEEENDKEKQSLHFFSHPEHNSVFLFDTRNGFGCQNSNLVVGLGMVQVKYRFY